MPHYLVSSKSLAPKISNSDCPTFEYVKSGNFLISDESLGELLVVSGAGVFPLENFEILML